MSFVYGWSCSISAWNNNFQGTIENFKVVLKSILASEAKLRNDQNDITFANSIDFDVSL